MKYDIQYMRKTAQQKGGDCRTQNYQGLRTHLEWVCKYGHTWMAQPQHIIHSESWCPRCADRNRAKKRYRYTIEDMREYARSRNGECLSDEYSGMGHHLKWKCGNGHKWKAVPASMIHRHSWCPHCRYLSEQKCRAIFENTFGEKFPSVMIDMDGEKLQLDGYCPTLGKAFEYQGQQHYKFMPHLHKTEKAFQLGQKRDTRKDQWCKSNGVGLFVIPYWENTNDDKLLSFITQETGVVATIDWSYFYSSLSVLNELRNLATSKEGSLLSDKYEGTDSKLEWKCKCGNIWEATPYSVKRRGTWCPVCANNIRRSIEDMQQLAEDRGGECLSVEYFNAHTKLKWKCSHDHIWETTPRAIQKNHWCPKCKRMKLC